MTNRIAAMALLLACAAQLLALWPMPQEVAARRIAAFSEAKNYWETTDPSKSDNPQWAAKTKAELLPRIDEVLANTDRIRTEAQVEWGWRVFSVLVTAAAAITAWLRASLHWRWLSLASLVVFMWLQQPWFVLRVFLFDGQVDLGRGIQQLVSIGSKSAGALSMMLLFNLAIPLLLVAVVTYAMLQFLRQRHNAL
jgi:hypothetical protein